MAITTVRMTAMVFFLMLPLTACTAQGTPSTIKDLDAETSMLLFSDDDNMSKEQPYYKALLKKSNNCTNDDVDIKIISSDKKDMVEYLDVTGFPSLYVLEGQNMIDNYEGSTDSADIEKFIDQYMDCETSNE
ncbi:hypothetical protein D7Z54_17075 [Salibacterium salarium]|uniref:Thioredoxin n=1 Tax=Salibacterium salarium TaxID=284579 RepID=A0A428N1E1_9BACI|nr:hypothetical protein [Salibacterium salarium]RSL32138.1 hypothetical protein D7Z54_17075 [Salibacterium salarium]